MRNRTIWKFAVPHGSVAAVSAPAHGKVVLTGIDRNTAAPTIWMELDPEADMVERRFHVVGTGHTIEGDGGYPYDLHAGSFIDGPFVWHIYERRHG